MCVYIYIYVYYTLELAKIRVVEVRLVRLVFREIRVHLCGCRGALCKVWWWYTNEVLATE